MMKTSLKMTGAMRKWAALALAMLLVLSSAVAMAKDGVGAPASPTASVLSMEEAKTIALQHVKLVETDVFITKLKADNDDGRAVFEVAFISAGTEYEYEVDAGDGTVLKTETEVLSAKQQSIDTSLYIGFDKALEAALLEAKLTAEDVTRIGVEFDFDDGRAEYEVEFVANGQKYQYDLDATTAEILKREIEKH